MKLPLKKAAALALLAATVTGAQAQVISWNLDRFGTLGAADNAGIVLVNNWNNSWPSNPTVDLVDNSGAATTLDLSYNSYNSWSIQGSGPSLDSDGSANKRLLNGYLNSGPAPWGPSITDSYVSLSQIPYAQYDIYIYFSSDAADRPGYVTDGVTSYYFNTLGAASIAGGNALFAQTLETSSLNHPGANYAVFSGLSGAAQTIRVQMEQDDMWGGIAGFQVVAVPEPSALALGVVGFLIVGARRWTRRS
jgi:hypothetical protein